MGWVCLEGWDGLNNYSETEHRSWRSVGVGYKYTPTGGRRGSGAVYDDVSGSTTARGMEFHCNYFRNTDVLYNVTVGQMPSTAVEIGVAIKRSGAGWNDIVSGFTYPLAELRTTSSSVIHWELRYIGTTWYLYQLYGATIRTSGVISSFALNQWYYFTFLFSGLEASTTTTKHNHGLMDGGQVYYVGGLTANATTTTAPTYMRIGTGNGVSGNLPANAQMYYDDIVMTYGGGTGFPVVVGSTLASSSYMGPVRVDKIVGNNDNIYHDDEFIASSGAGDPERPMVDDPTPDGDATYVYSSTIGHTAQGGIWGASDTAMLPFVPSTIWGVRTFAVLRNAGQGIARMRADVAMNNVQSLGTYTYSLPADGNWYGMMSFGAPYEGSRDGTTNLWQWATGASGAIQLFSPLVTYVS